jgi:hypothetical protein
MHARHLTRFGLLSATLLVAGVVWGQQPGGGFPGGGGGGRGNFKFDPGMFFDRIANGRTSIAISEVPSRPNDPSAQERLQQWATQNGITNGQLTRDQFVSYLESRRAERRANGQGGGPPVAAPAMPANPGAPVPTPQGPGGAAPEQGGAAPVTPVPEPEEDARPTVHRPGKLPKGLPDWFARLDTDGDGQVGLYEWKEAGRSLEEFRKLDRNGDGFITVEEALRATKNATAAAGGPGRTPRPGDDTAEESSSGRSGNGNAVTSNSNAQQDRSNRRPSDGSRPWQNNRRRGGNRPGGGRQQGGSDPQADDN